ncbi:MAG: hypothetical protein HYX48_07230 [Chlamydiales bacterium]|nr:hypothetical protein [Chlamydiales bacterium]
MSDGVRWRHTSRDHLALHLALPNRVLESRVGLRPTLHAWPAFLCYGFALRSESIDCSRRSSHFLRRGSLSRPVAGLCKEVEEKSL